MRPFCPLTQCVANWNWPDTYEVQVLAQTAWKDLAALYGWNPASRCATVTFKQCKDIMLTWLIHGIMKSCLVYWKLCFHFLCPDWKWCTNMENYCYFSSIVFGIDGVFSPLLPDSTIGMNYSQQKERGTWKSPKHQIWMENLLPRLHFLVPSFQGGWKSLGWKSSNIRFPA